jgi:hypothetical protein
METCFWCTETTIFDNGVCRECYDALIETPEAEW